MVQITNYKLTTDPVKTTMSVTPTPIMARLPTNRDDVTQQQFLNVTSEEFVVELMMNVTKDEFTKDTIYNARDNNNPTTDSRMDLPVVIDRSETLEVVIPPLLMPDDTDRVDKM